MGGGMLALFCLRRVVFPLFCWTTPHGWSEFFWFILALSTSGVVVLVEVGDIVVWEVFSKGCTPRESSERGAPWYWKSALLDC